MDSPITRTQLSPNCHSGGRNVSWVAIHTQEGPGSAASLTNYLGNPANEVSYNGVVDDRESVLVVPWDMNPWSATNANSRADHLCAAGTYAAWTAGKWESTDASDGKNEDLELTSLAELTAWRCQVRGLPPKYVGNYGNGPFPPAEPGICGHMDFGSWGGGHHDPGTQFPWDEFIRRVQSFYNGGTMGFLSETLKNFQGTTVTAGTVLYYLDKKVDEVHSQIVDGWAQLGKNGKGEALTLVDSQAVQIGLLHDIKELQAQAVELQQKTYDFLNAKQV